MTAAGSHGDEAGQRLRLGAQLAAHGVWLCAARLSLLARETKYDANQPRVPAGDPAGGQWTSGGGGLDWKNPAKKTNRPTTRADEKKFVNDYRKQAQDLATKLGRGSNANEFLALSSDETSWGVTETASNANNFFGLHNQSSGPFPGQIGTYLTSGQKGVVGTLLPYWMPPTPDSDPQKATPVFTVSTGYFDSGSVVANILAKMGGDYSNPATFFANIRAAGWAVKTPHQTYINTLMQRYGDVSRY
jgi:hypothetical protein